MFYLCVYMYFTMCNDTVLACDTICLELAASPEKSEPSNVSTHDDNSSANNNSVDAELGAQTGVDTDAETGA